MRTKIVMFLSGMVFALVCMLAVKAFRSYEPAQDPEPSVEVTEQTEEETVEVSDEPEREITVEAEEIGELPVVKPDEEPEQSSDLRESESAVDTETDSEQTDTDKNNDIQLASARVITLQTEDRIVIPDKYNCGAKGSLLKVLPNDTVNGIILKESGGINAFDFFYRNTEIAGEVLFNSYDFSDYIVDIYNADQIDREITLVFENCKFSQFRSLTAYPKVKLVFRNCTFNSFYGSCAEFSYCSFGGFYKDGLVPYHDITVNNCYFSSFTSQDAAGSGVHTDGTQIYGKEGINAENIRYEHCRFELPCIPGANAINACIMLQMEFSNGIGITFNDCICNGGGYTIYASSKDKGFQYYQNVVISNIAIGQSRKYGQLYPTVRDGVEISNLYDIDSLYVASVWKGNGKTHLSVTNDTLQDRLLVVYADGEYYEFTIPASRGGKTDYFENFSDYPIDIDICIEKDCGYLVCFDRTSGMDKQIRFASWDGSSSVSIPM